jgi:hypothetical protein
VLERPRHPNGSMCRRYQKGGGALRLRIVGCGLEIGLAFF